VEAVAHAWPWTAQIVIDGRHQCGASLIHPSFVLTAAHCFTKSRGPERHKVFLGGHDTLTGAEHTVLNITVHPAYQIGNEQAYDLALMRWVGGRVVENIF